MVLVSNPMLDSLNAIGSCNDDPDDAAGFGDDEIEVGEFDF